MLNVRKYLKIQIKFVIIIALLFINIFFSSSSGKAVGLNPFLESIEPVLSPSQYSYIKFDTTHLEEKDDGNLLPFNVSHTIIDDDGIATLSFVHFSLIQGICEKIYHDTHNRLTYLNKNVEDWDVVYPVVKSIFTWIEKNMTEQRRFNSLFPLMKDWVNDWKQRSPTYLELSDKVGCWLEQNSCNFAYIIENYRENKLLTKNQYLLIANNVSSPLQFLSSRSFDLNAHWVSKSRMSLQGDIRNILKNFIAHGNENTL